VNASENGETRGPPRSTLLKAPDLKKIVFCRIGGLFCGGGRARPENALKNIALVGENGGKNHVEKPKNAKKIHAGKPNDASLQRKKRLTYTVKSGKLQSHSRQAARVAGGMLILQNEPN